MSPKQLAWSRFIKSRYGENWGKLTSETQLALKQAWYGGWAARQYVQARHKKAR